MGFMGPLGCHFNIAYFSEVVWIAATFTDEHKKALDWLNDLTSDDVSFYGVRLELWQIDDSKPAIRFNVVSHPPEIKKQTAIKTSIEDLSETRKTQLEFWVEFRKALLDNKILKNTQSPRPQFWFDVALGKSGIHLSNTANINNGKLSTRLYIGSRLADAVLEQFGEQKESIESELGVKLIWNPNPENIDKVIMITRDVDFSNKNKWPEYIEWLTDMTARFRKVFIPRIRKLKFARSKNK